MGVYSNECAVRNEGYWGQFYYVHFKKRYVVLVFETYLCYFINTRFNLHPEGNTLFENNILVIIIDLVSIIIDVLIYMYN